MNPLHLAWVRPFFRRWQAASIAAHADRAAAMADHPASQSPTTDDDPVTRIRRTCTVCFGSTMVTNRSTGAEYPCECRTGFESDRINRKAFGQ